MKRAIFAMAISLYGVLFAARAPVDESGIIKDAAYLIWHMIQGPCYKYYRNPRSAGFKLGCRCKQEDWLSLKDVGDVVTYHNGDGKLLSKSIANSHNSSLMLGSFTQRLDPSFRPKANHILITPIGCYAVNMAELEADFEKMEVLDWAPYHPNKVKLMCDIMDQSREYVDFSALKKVADGKK